MKKQPETANLTLVAKAFSAQAPYFDELYDAYKLENEVLNISILDQKQNNLVMHTVQGLSADEKVPVTINVAEPGEYTVQFTPKANFSYSGSLYWIDRNESKSIVASAENVYNFKVGKGGTYATRFYLSLNPVVEQRSLSESFSLFPNPVVNDLTIETGVLEPVSVEIYNSLGQIVHSAMVSESAVVSTRDWSKGMYIVKGRYEKGIAAKRIIKQ